MNTTQKFMFLQIMINVCLAVAVFVIPRFDKKTIDIASAANIAYSNQLALFVERAVTTAPPNPIKTTSDQVKTCVYINNQDGMPTPNICVKLLKELNTCAKMEQPTDRCYLLIGARDEQQN